MEMMENGQKNLISFIIPYKHSEERYPLFLACLRSLPNPYLYEGIEICVIEVGEERHLYDGCFPYEVEYIFVKCGPDNIFHRAWILNAGVKYLSSGKTLVLVDADMILTYEWFEELLANMDKTYIGWGKIHCLSRMATEHYIKHGVIYPDYITVKKPSKTIGNGGITIIPKNVYYMMKGVPENFKGTWGGEDNALFLKLKKLGFSRGIYKTGLYHLYHSKSTPRIPSILNKIQEMKNWKKGDWRTELRNIGDNWGTMNGQNNKIFM